MQLPPMPPDPNIIIPQIIPLFGMMTGILITGFIILGPVGRAIGDVIRHLFGAHKKSEGALGGDVDDLRERLDAMNQQLGELAERQDFTERMLAQVRKDRALAGGTDVAG
jgi:hypothetical protein